MNNLIWLRKILSVRNRLIVSGKGKKNDQGTLRAFEDIKRDVTMLNFKSDEQVKNYILRNKGKIAKILPGTGSGSFKKFNREFLSLVQ